MSGAPCPYCLDVIDSRIHFETCPKCDRIQKEAKFAIHFINNESVCLKCFRMMATSDYVNHNRNCGRQQKRKSETSSNKFEAKSFSHATSKQVPSQTLKKNLAYYEEHNGSAGIRQEQHQGPLEKFLYSHCQKYLIAYLKPHLLNWLDKNKCISSIILFKVFEKYTHRIVDSLEVALPNIELSSIYQVSKKIDWTSIITRVEDIYNKQLILERISLLTEAEQNSIKRALNKIYLKYSGIFQLFNLSKEVYTPKNPRDKKPLLPREFLQIVSQLFSTQKIGFIFLALQLMIIYQCGQRFPSSLQAIEANIAKLISVRKSNIKQNSFFMISTKTGSKEMVVLDEQLLQLLDEFQWTKFSQNKRFYQRLSQYFPFSCYSLRRGFICFMYLCSNTNASSAIRLLTNHKNEKNVNYYIRSLIKSVHLQAKSMLRIPNSHILYTSKSQLIQMLPQLNIFTDRIQLQPNWFNRTYHKLITIVNTQVRSCLKIKQTFVNPQKANQQDKKIDGINEQKIDLNNPQRQITDSEDEVIEQCFINGRAFRMANRKFNFMGQYGITNNGTCHHCLTPYQSGFACQNCGNCYHQSCLPNRFCSCHSLNLDIQGILLGEKELKSQIKLKMPQEYFGSQFDDLQQIKFLIFMRGLNFTNVGVMTDLCKKTFRKEDFDELEIAEIELPQYEQYERYRYFPPLQLVIFGQNNLTGSGFGLVAKKDINQKRVFLGQYAGDILLGSELKFTQRKDMIMELHSFETPSKSLNIGPIRHGSYVMLVNQSRNPNCAVAKAIINGKYKIVLYNTKKIKKGAQLFYDYNRLSQQNDEADVSEAELSELQQSNQKYVSIANIHNNCYLNSVLQLLWKLRQSFIWPSSQHLTPFSIQLQSFLRITGGYYNPATLIEIINSLTTKFILNRHEDAHQLLDFILDSLEKQLVNFDSWRSIKVLQRQCLQCGRTESTEFSVQLIVLGKEANPFEKFVNMLGKQERHDDHECPQCKQVGKTKMKEKFIKLADIIVFVYNRFQNRGKKNDKAIIIPPLVKINQSTFKKVAVILHKGKSLQKGHYTFYDLQSKVEIDDNKIIKNDGINTKEAYIVAYKHLI